MQFGVFTVGDLTSDPTTGRTRSEAERIKAIAKHAEEVGLDGPTHQARVDAAALAALDSDTDSNVLQGSVR